MKISQYLSLLKFHFSTLWGTFVISALYGFMYVPLRSSNQFYSLNFPGPESLLLVVPMMGILALFSDANVGMQGMGGRIASNLEFFFTRPIPRSSLFGVKAGLYLFLGLMPVAGVWAYSHADPAIRVQMPYRTHQDTEETRQQFYLTHFEGAYVQQEGGENKISSKTFVVLPKGQVERAAFTLVCILACALISQVIVFVFFPVKLWVVYMVFFGLLMVSMLGILSTETPSHYEKGLAWFAQHTSLTFLILGVSTVLSQFYCCRRFVQTEITT